MGNQQSQWVVACVRADDGTPDQRVVWAVSREAAMREASGGGLLAQDASEIPTAPAADPAVLEALGRLQSGLFEIQTEMRRIRDVKLLRAPCTTIGWGIVLGLIFWMLIVALFWVAIFVLLGFLGIALRPPPFPR